VPSPAPSSSPGSFSYTAELRRKALHVLALAVPFGMAWLGAPAAQIVVGAGALVAVAADVARAYSPTINEWVRRVFGSMMRDAELPGVGTGLSFNGATAVLVGAALVGLLFSLRVAVPVLTATMLADAAAALVGRRWGRHSWGRLSATVEGSAAFVATGLAVVAAFGTLAPGPAVVGIVGGAVVEAFPLPLNDNIRVPLAVAALIVGADALGGGPWALG